jgi:hypothetical protein
MRFGLRGKKVQATVDRQRQVDIGYATKRLEQGDLSLVAGLVDRSITLTLRNISLMEPRLAHRAVEGGIRGRIARGLYYFYVPQQQSPEPMQELVEVDRGTITIAVEGQGFAYETA